ncbi:MAG TPA: tRNA lysidine(34) synthetase TilS [Bacteroidales bacterium]
MSLFEKFKQVIHTVPEKKFLLAVSGGIDSMVMMHLFYRLKSSCAVVHCNFQLRGEESDGDEAFVREQASKLYYKAFVTRFETEEYALENHLSIQMAARELRYTWFEKLLKVHQFDFISVAHNRDDAIETFFINLARGSGIAGLTGMRPTNGNVIRPLLSASRAEIEQYANENGITFREDSSNASDKYLRNYIRHQLIPDFEEAFPHFRETMAQNLEKLNDAYSFYKQAVNDEIDKITRLNEKLLFIDIPQLLTTPASKTVLFEILKNYGFSPATVDEIFNVTRAISGKQFVSATHKLVKDRDCFIVSELENEGNIRYYVDESTKAIENPIHLTLEILDKTMDFLIEKRPTLAFLDYDKLEFPLMLRKWQPGDYFAPLGMNGMKKLSDFFIDQKLSLIDKQNTWLLLSGNHIVWVIGKRIDDRFKVTETTQRILKIS